MSYLFWKLLHVIAVILLVGNITTGILWKVHADRTRDPALIAHTCTGLMRSDRWFTQPGVALIIVAGIAAAIAGHLPILGTGWIFWSIVLFAISGLAFMLRVAPLQRRMHAIASAGTAMDWPAYEAATRAWNLWGMIALLTPAIAVALMVLKPALPAP